MNLFILFANALFDPGAAIRDATRQPRPVLVGAIGLGMVCVLGLATLPRQLSLLASALAPAGDVLRDMHHAAMRSGLLRVVIADRLVPPPTVVLAGVILAVAAEPVLALAGERRGAIWTVALLGMTPLIAQRAGELAVTYLAAVGSLPTPGEAVALPQRFSTGPLLLWGAGEAPAWLVSLSQRLDLITFWCLVPWTIGLRELDGRRLASWHVVLPLTSLAFGGLATWWLAPLATSALLGPPQ
jgi:hypothetical protein